MRAEGVDVMYDIYNECLGVSVITVILPAWYQGMTEAQRNTPLTQKKLALLVRATSRLLGFGFRDIQIAYIGPGYEKYEGKTVHQIAQEEGMPDLKAYLMLCEKSNFLGRVNMGPYSTPEIIHAFEHEQPVSGRKRAEKDRARDPGVLLRHSSEKKLFPERRPVHMKKSCAMLLLAILLAFLAGTATGEAEITTKEQLNQPGMKIGVSTGSASAEFAEDEFPEATIVYLEENTIAYESVAQGKIHAYVFDRDQMQKAIDSGRKGVRLLDENMNESVRVAVGISPNASIPDLQNRLNIFIREIKADGTLDDMMQRWVDDGNETMPEIPPAQDPQLHLTVGTSGIVPPYSFYAGQDLSGMDIELAYRFAAWLGADVRFKVYDYGAIIPAAVTGDVDCIMANLNITPERQEALPFSDVLYERQIGIMVKGNDSQSSGFIDRIRESFNKTFVREDRWKMFLSGVMTTLLITLLSILGGTALGFAVFLLCRNGNRAANAITHFCTWLIQGMPMVVLLMILYYIIFSKSAISGPAVAIIGFTLTFGATVFGLLKMGVGAVDRGQYEAAYALGYSNRRTFFQIILPQALPHVLPSYKGEIVSLIKATSIVGYIAVQDLTKMGDIVRSRTYEAFFPLIAITIIYFLLEGLLGFLVSRISLNFNPKRRKPETILKGVKTDD